MKTKEFIEKYQMILILSLAVVIMGIIKLTYRYEGTEKDSQNLITPTITVMPTPKTTMITEEYPLWKYIPYEEDTFKVEKYSQPLTIVVKLKKGDKAEAYEKVIKWMSGLKISIPAHDIVWE